nr:hypothetical protein GCM10020093_059670 [Planobispora longispora]
MDPRHRDLAGSVIEGRDFTVGANPPDVAPLRLHGTYMASLIAGHGHGAGGRDGVIGVAPRARVLSVRVILEDEEAGFRRFNTAKRFENVVARGIRYAVDHGADVINMSISKELATREERAAIRYAVSKGWCSSRRRATTGRAGGAGTPRTPTRPPSPGWSRSRRRTGAAPGVVLQRQPLGPGGRARGGHPGRGSRRRVLGRSRHVAGDRAGLRGGRPDKSEIPENGARSGRAGAHRRGDAPPAGGYDTGTGFGVVNAAGRWPRPPRSPVTPTPPTATASTTPPARWVRRASRYG